MTLTKGLRIGELEAGVRLDEETWRNIDSGFSCHSPNCTPPQYRRIRGLARLIIFSTYFPPTINAHHSIMARRRNPQATVKEARMQQVLSIEKIHNLMPEVGNVLNYRSATIRDGMIKRRSQSNSMDHYVFFPLY